MEINFIKDTALYGRQSIDKKDSVSIEAQFEKGHALCTLNNWNIYNEYYDKGYSGKDTNRPAFQKLIKDIEQGHIRRVIAYRLDRISRSITDFSNLITFFEKYNVTFISSTENFDTSSPLGRAMIYIIMVFAQLERETIAERITDNYYYRAKQGLFMGGNIPFGFKSKKVINSDGKKTSILEVDNTEANIVKNIYNYYSGSNHNIRSIAEKLNFEGIKTRNNKLWCANQISRILTRPIYTSNSLDIYNYFFNTNINIINPLEEFDGKNSLTIIKKETGKGKYKKIIDISEQLLVIVKNIKPLVDSNTWLAVQNKMKKNKQYAPRTSTSKKCFLSGLFKCGYCKYNMSLKTNNKSNATYSYILCNTKKNRGYNICSSKLHKVSEIEELVLSHLIKYIKNKNIVKEMEKIKETKQIDISLINKKHLLEANINKSNNEIQNLLKIVSDGNSVANNYIQNTIENIDNKIKKYKAELFKLEAEIYNTTTKYEQLKNIENYLKEPEQIINSDFDTKQTICKSFIKQIIIYNEKITIDYII